jgi:hypothetical protein
MEELPSGTYEVVNVWFQGAEERSHESSFDIARERPHLNLTAEHLPRCRPAESAQVNVTPLVRRPGLRTVESVWKVPGRFLRGEGKARSVSEYPKSGKLVVHAEWGPLVKPGQTWSGSPCRLL